MNTGETSLEPRMLEKQHVSVLPSQLPAPSSRSAVRLPFVAEGINSQVQEAKVMIVDDEPINIKVVEKHLAGIGCHRFIPTSNPTEVLGLLVREEPDLVLLDIAMPEMNGLDLLRAIRREPRWKCLPVVVLTAFRDPETRREALEAGCTDFLSKPVDPCELALRVRNILIGKAYYDLVAQQADQLAEEVRTQAEALAAARSDAEMRYLAGKAEIATEVLHNVGNALNSVNVGVNLVSSTIRKSKVISLRRAVDLLREHEGNLTRFLTKDERGHVLPSYLCEVAESLVKERDKMTNEVELVLKHLDHINAIVATQQRYAALGNVRDEVQLEQMLNDVDELLGGTITKQGIEVIRNYDAIPPVWTDRQKLVQIFLNVFKNAVDSIKLAHRQGAGRLTIQLKRQNDTHACVEVTDNGVGISPQNLTKVFSHGFTTKRDGHGFGLHSCANMLKELGGSIQALSAGVGQGATFRMEVPFKTKEN